MNRKASDGHAGQRLRQIRQHRGISQGKIAKAIGVSVGTIQNYERGRVAITTDRLEQLARALQCEPADLLRPPESAPPRYLYRTKPRWWSVSLALLSIFLQPAMFAQDDDMADRIFIREVTKKAPAREPGPRRAKFRNSKNGVPGRQSSDDAH